MADSSQPDMDDLRLELAMERKKLEEERKKLELERKTLQEEKRKQQMDVAEALRLKLDLERQRLEEERQKLALEKQKQEEEYKKLQDDLRRQVHLGNDTRVPEVVVHSTGQNRNSSVSSEGSSISLSNNPDSTRSPDGADKADMICVVCGDKANGMHYKALTCEGCKIFFRRNSKRQDSLKCNNEIKGQCEMDLYMRRHCAYCRMKKCLDQGMQIGRVWDKERCKTRKPMKKAAVSPPLEKEPKLTPSEVDKQEVQKNTVTSVSSPVPALTDEQRELIAVVNNAFWDALKDVKELPDKTTHSIDDLRKLRELKGATSELQENIIAQALIESVDMDALYSPNYFQDFLQQSDIFSGDIEGISSGQEAVKSLDEGNIELDEEMCKHFMELIVVGLKHLISFVKALPGFLELSPEDQAALVKDTFPDYFCIKGAGCFNVEHMAFMNNDVPYYTLDDMKLAGFGGWIDTFVAFARKWYKLKPTDEELAAICTLCVMTPATFADYFCIKVTGCYNIELQAFTSGEKNIYTVKEMRDSGFGGWVEMIIPFATKMVRLELTPEERVMLCAMCVFTPDRPSLSAQAKQIIAVHHEKLISALCASVRSNHTDQPQYFAKVVGLLTELRNCTECLMEQILQLKLKGQAIIPILGEVLDI